MAEQFKLIKTTFFQYVDVPIMLLYLLIQTRLDSKSFDLIIFSFKFEFTILSIGEKL